MKPTVLELVDKLQALGSSRQIADFFQQENIRGHQDSGSWCVVARYLKKNSASGYVGACATFVQDGCKVLPLRPLSPLSEFITDFDAGIYPALAVGSG